MERFLALPFEAELEQKVGRPRWLRLSVVAVGRRHEEGHLTFSERTRMCWPGAAGRLMEEGGSSL